MYTSDLTEAQKAFIKETIPMDNWTSKYDFFSSLMLFYTWTRPAVNGEIYLMTSRHGRPYITISVHGVPSVSSRICLTALSRKCDFRKVRHRDQVSRL